MNFLDEMSFSFLRAQSLEMCMNWIWFIIENKNPVILITQIDSVWKNILSRNTWISYSLGSCNIDGNEVLNINIALWGIGREGTVTIWWSISCGAEASNHSRLTKTHERTWGIGKGQLNCNVSRMVKSFSWPYSICLGLVKEGYGSDSSDCYLYGRDIYGNGTLQDL